MTTIDLSPTGGAAIEEEQAQAERSLAMRAFIGGAIGMAVCAVVWVAIVVAGMTMADTGFPMTGAIWMGVGVGLFAGAFLGSWAGVMAGVAKLEHAEHGAAHRRDALLGS